MLVSQARKVAKLSGASPRSTAAPPLPPAAPRRAFCRRLRRRPPAVQPSANVAPRPQALHAPCAHALCIECPRCTRAQRSSGTAHFKPHTLRPHGSPVLSIYTITGCCPPCERAVDATTPRVFADSPTCPPPDSLCLHHTCKRLDQTAIMSTDCQVHVTAPGRCLLPSVEGVGRSRQRKAAAPR